MFSWCIGMKDPLNSYKLIILYILSRVEFPLTRVQVFDYVLNNKIATYFELQQTIAELIDAEFISAGANKTTSFLEITEQGMETLGYFEDRIVSEIKEAISDYFERNISEIKSDRVLSTSCHVDEDGKYRVKLSSEYDDGRKIEINIEVYNEEEAREACRRFKRKGIKLHSYILGELF